MEEHVNIIPRDSPYNGIYAEAAPKKGTFFRLRVYKRIGKFVIYSCFL